MKKEKAIVWDKTDLKIFILCLLNEMRHPMTYTAIIDTVIDCGCVGSYDFAECFSELTEKGHIFHDTVGNETYYMISDTGSMVARELRSDVRPELLDRASIAAARHLELAKLGVVLFCDIRKTDDGRYNVSFHINKSGDDKMLDLTVNVASEDRARKIKEHCEGAKAESIYRGILSVITGDIDYFL